MAKTFSEEIKIKGLLWSDRHCCVCGAPCGLDIEIAHIDPKGGEDSDNAIPVCYKHHAEIGRYIYDKKHPRGNKYRIKELKKRRDQIYEKYTRHLVPPLLFYLMPRLGDSRPSEVSLPKVAFVIENRGIFLPAKFKVNVRVFLGDEELKPRVKSKYYADGIVWNLNAGHIFFGNFDIPRKCVDSTENLRIEVQVTVIDQYDRLHKLLPNCFYYVRDKGCWYTEPTSFNELKRFMKQ